MLNLHSVHLHLLRQHAVVKKISCLSSHCVLSKGLRISLLHIPQKGKRPSKKGYPKYDSASDSETLVLESVWGEVSVHFYYSRVHSSVREPVTFYQWVKKICLKITRIRWDHRPKNLENKQKQKIATHKM